MKRGAIEEFVPESTPKRVREYELPPPPEGIVFDQPEEKYAIERAIRGESLLITASAGFGKSTLTAYIVVILRDLYGYDAVITTGSTGVAALRLGVGSMTLHSFAGFQLGRSKDNKLLTPEQCVSRIEKPLRERWLSTRALVIDEISMLGMEYFEQVEQVARIVRKTGPVFFGGIQVVMVGDFFQLPPVKADYVFQAKIWKAFIGKRGTILLKKPYRQSDATYLHALEMIKLNTLDDSARAMIEACRTPHREREGYSADWTIVHLLPHRSTVDAINKCALDSLRKPLVAFHGKFTGSEYYRRNLDNLLVDDELKLCEGCRVMLVVNEDVGMGLANGATGKVMSFTGANGLPVVHWDMTDMTTVVQQHVWKFRDDFGTERANYRHLPLINANATTIHKAQGLTIHKVCADIGSVFGLEMIYVALSRTRSIEDLHIAGADRVNWARLKPDPRVAAWYAEIKNN